MALGGLGGDGGRGRGGQSRGGQPSIRRRVIAASLTECVLHSRSMVHSPILFSTVALCYLFLDHETEPQVTLSKQWRYDANLCMPDSSAPNFTAVQHYKKADTNGAN